jgi:hypothetical protein
MRSVWAILELYSRHYHAAIGINVQYLAIEIVRGLNRDIDTKRCWELIFEVEFRLLGASAIQFSAHLLATWHLRCDRDPIHLWMRSQVKDGIERSAERPKANNPSSLCEPMRRDDGGQ